MITYVQGDIFQSGAEALVNPVNCVGAMGKGLALQFRQRFPANNKEYLEACHAGSLRPGQICAVKNGARAPQWILNVATKDHWRHPSREEWISSGLANIRRLCQELGIRSVAIPALGAGLGGLPWSWVQQEIERQLEDMQDVTALVYAPMPRPSSQRPKEKSQC